jgi:hypothetical protein
VGVSEEQAREVVAFFRDHDVPTLIIGGVAIVAQGGRATEDVDLFVATRDFAGLEDAISGDSRVREFGTVGSVSKFYFRLRSRRVEIRVDVLNPQVFSGTRSGDEFFGFIWDHHSYDSNAGRMAKPEVVWYTRLLVPRMAYRDKIAQDIENGAPVEWLDRALEIARHFGRTKIARSRALEVTKLLGTLGVGGPPTTPPTGDPSGPHRKE